MTDDDFDDLDLENDPTMHLAERLVVTGEANDAMSAGHFDDAARKFEHLVELCAGEENHQFWARMALGEAWFRQSQWERALKVYGAAYHDAPKLALGNPLFHMRVGQCLFELHPERQRERGPGTALDNLARALITGGVEIFDTEAARYLAAITEVLLPPAGAPSWEATRGGPASGRALLVGAADHAFLWDMLHGRNAV